MGSGAFRDFPIQGVVNLATVTDTKHPDLLASHGEDDAPGTDSERPEPGLVIGEGLGKLFRVSGEPLLDGNLDALADGRIEAGNVPPDDLGVVEDLELSAIVNQDQASL
ncbi:MAG TPA: hypothetical protein VNM67_18105 [Thermoanaerobaculia bacterium]|nr:hypothetical protein [Thermoanaerobaculia bacterium]